MGACGLAGRDVRFEDGRMFESTAVHRIFCHVRMCRSSLRGGCGSGSASVVIEVGLSRSCSFFRSNEKSGGIGR